MYRYVTHLGVVLGAVRVSSAVETDDLVTEHVRAGGEGSRNLDVPGEVVLCHDSSITIFR
jgi:hypothetical protein